MKQLILYFVLLTSTVNASTLTEAKNVINGLSYDDTLSVESYVTNRIDNWVVPGTIIDEGFINTLLSNDTKINMADYFPISNRELHYLEVDGSLHMISKWYEYAIHPYWGVENNSYTLLQEKHYAIGNDLCLFATQPIRVFADGGVKEMGGISSFNASKAGTCHHSLADQVANSPHYVRYVKNGQIVGLNWGSHGGNAPDDSFDGMYHANVQVSGKTIKNAWSTIHVDKVYDEYKPTYGRDESTGEWCKGCGRTYNNAIEISFFHGSTGRGFTGLSKGVKRMISGYATFGFRMVLAPGIGQIERQLVFAETGTSLGLDNVDLRAAIRNNPDAYTQYIDSTVSTF